MVVHTEMLAQVAVDYPSLPDPRTLEAEQIRFFYNWIRPTLRDATKPR